MDFLNSLTVNTLYIVLLAIGLVYAVFLLLSGQIGGEVAGGEGAGDLAGDLGAGLAGGHDLDAQAGDHGISPISPLTISTFITAFGAIGLVAINLFNASERASVIWAVLGGFVFSLLVYVGFTYLFIKPQGSSEVRVAELAGHVAEVITPIPADGMGEVALTAQGGRVTYSARASNAQAIPRGASVKVVRITGGVAYVDLIPESD
jgi:membrane protein implicated in regulation of membrane protease activity